MLGRVWRNGDAVVIVVDPCFGVISYLYYISMLDIINIHIIIYYYWQYTYLCVMTIKCDPINPLLIQCITLISDAIYNLSHLKNRYDRINSIPCYQYNNTQKIHKHQTWAFVHHYHHNNVQPKPTMYHIH